MGVAYSQIVTPSVTASQSVTSTSLTSSPSAAFAGPNSALSNILVIARDDATAQMTSSGLLGYGIPFTSLIVPQSGVALPALSGSTGGNFGGIVIVSQVSYDYGGTQGFQSALTIDQWNQLYAYQLQYGVRMVHLDVFPGPSFGATALGGCCNAGVEQLISFTDTSAFATSGIKTGAGVSTMGLWHYPSTISNTTSTKQVAKFAASGQFSESTAAVINNFDGRQQVGTSSCIAIISYTDF